MGILAVLGIITIVVLFSWVFGKPEEYIPQNVWKSVNRDSTVEVINMSKGIVTYKYLTAGGKNVVELNKVYTSHISDFSKEYDQVK